MRVTHITDPGCPWAYSIEPSITTLRWRYGDQLEWRIVLIGLTESGAEYDFALRATAQPACWA